MLGQKPRRVYLICFALDCAFDQASHKVIGNFIFKRKAGFQVFYLFPSFLDYGNELLQASMRGHVGRYFEQTAEQRLDQCRAETTHYSCADTEPKLEACPRLDENLVITQGLANQGSQSRLLESAFHGLP